MKICAVQIRPIAGDVTANATKHMQLLDIAIAQGADLVFFPELSLTGYEPRLAKSLASHKDDPSLEEFQQKSDEHTVTIGVGLPISQGSKVLIGMVWFSHHVPRRLYSKQQLHADEIPFFAPGHSQLVLNADEHTLAPAICYESLQLSHANEAATLGADVYMASVAKPAAGLARAMRHYPAIAQQHRMFVIMADCVGPSDNFISVGQSAVWNRNGDLLRQMDSESEGLVILDTRTEGATIHTLMDEQKC